MNGRKRESVILSLIQALRDKDSWCGETHVQKSTYFLQELMRVPLELDFILYKHGPFSFDLKDELSSMKSDMILKSISNEPYGPSLALGSTSNQILENYPNTIEQYKREVQYVSEKLAKCKVSELERLATALYVKNNKEHDGTSESRADILIKLKPHVSKEEAKQAIETVDNYISEAEVALV